MANRDKFMERDIIKPYFLKKVKLILYQTKNKRKSVFYQKVTY